MREVIEGAGGDRGRDPALGRPRELAGRLRDRRRRRADGRARRRRPRPTARRRTRSRRPGTRAIDTTELGLARACLRDGKPVLGICRGSQVLNVAAGGTLVQDVPSTGTPLVHMGEWVRVVDDPPSCYHEIEVLAGTRLAGWLGAGTHVVNSYHHQAVERLGDGPAHRRGRARRHDRGRRVDQRRVRRRPAVAQRVPHARRRALRPPAAGARRGRARVRRRSRAGGTRRAPRERATSTRLPAASARRRRRATAAAMRRGTGPRPGSRRRA